MQPHHLHLAATIARERRAALCSAAESHRLARRSGTTTRPLNPNRGRR